MQPGNRLPAVSQILSNLAEKFGGDTQIGGYLGIGKPVDQMRILAEKGEVSFFGRGTDVLQDSALKSYVLMFGDNPEIGIEFWIVRV